MHRLGPHRPAESDSVFHAAAAEVLAAAVTGQAALGAFDTQFAAAVGCCRSAEVPTDPGPE